MQKMKQLQWNGQILSKPHLSKNNNKNQKIKIKKPHNYHRNWISNNNNNNNNKTIVPSKLQAQMASLVNSIKLKGFPGGSDVKASARNTGDLGLIPGSERSPGEGNGNPLQYSCLESHGRRRLVGYTVHKVPKSWTRLSDFTFLRKKEYQPYGNICRRQNKKE